MLCALSLPTQWCRKFGQQYANQLRHRRPRPGDTWHLDEVFLTIHGKRHYLWRAVDQDGNVFPADLVGSSRGGVRALVAHGGAPKTPVADARDIAAARFVRSEAPHGRILGGPVWHYARRATSSR
jgi:hypothetical protein